MKVYRLERVVYGPNNFGGDSEPRAYICAKLRFANVASDLEMTRELGCSSLLSVNRLKAAQNRTRRLCSKEEVFGVRYAAMAVPSPHESPSVITSGIIARASGLFNTVRSFTLLYKLYALLSRSARFAAYVQPYTYS